MSVERKRQKQEYRDYTGLIDVDLNDYYRVCPYNLSDLRSSSRERNIVVWRHLGILIMYIDKRADYSQEYCENFFNRKHGIIFHMIENNIHLMDYKHCISEILMHATEKEDIIEEDVEDTVSTPLDYLFNSLFESKELKDYEEVKAYALKNFKPNDLKKLIDYYNENINPNKL